MNRPKRKKRLSSFQAIIVGFIGVIFIGAVLLMLPVSTVNGQTTGFMEALFTSTSAVCVTGLVVADTATHWTPFGQVVILCLIQIGGLGVISVAAFIAVLSGRKISLMQRSMMKDAISAHQIGGVVKMTEFIFKVAFTVEFVGALAMMPFFIGNFGEKGIWMSFFHSISAFCNAGFDLMGRDVAKFVSLTGYSGSVTLTTAISLLIVLGGLGFMSWNDVITNRFHFKRYRMQTKVILTTTLILIILPAVFFFCGEFAGYPLRERFCLSVFQAITPRTAGFNTADLVRMTSASRMLIVVLMFIGGSPGSTAGGIKTTTIAVLYATAASVFRREKNAKLFNRRIEDQVAKTAATLLTMYVTLAGIGAFVISICEDIPVGQCFFETASAIGTVGLTLGITPSLGTVSRLILIVLMFLGRVGGLTLIYAAISGKTPDISQSPVEKITVG